MYPHQGVYYNSYHGPQGYYPADMAPPVTPLDLSYSQSMLPSNLLVNSPYIQQTQNMVPMSPILPRQYAPPPLNLSHGNLAHHQQQLSQMHSQHQHQSQQHHSQHPHYVPNSPYLTPLSSKSNLEQLNLSRTVILKNIDDNVSLNELLNSIDFGPIEYCKMYSRPAPERFRDSKNLKTCVISFVNSKISINFHIKYSKNRYNLNKLKETLRNSKYLKVSLNESTNASSNGNINNFNSHLNKQDYIKLKTLNYILEFNATRCLLIRLHSNDFTSFNIEGIENDVTRQCSKFGEIEDFKISTNETKSEVKCLIHFTSIDAAIKSYEFYLKKIQADKQEQIDFEGTDKSEDAIEYVQASFHKDRCDRTVIDKPSSGSNTNSPILSKRQTTTINQNNIIPEDLDEPNPDTEGEELENYREESVLNDQSILENNESIRNALLSNAKDPQEPNYDQISSKSSSSQNIDQSYISNTSSYMLNTYPSINQSQVRMQMSQVPNNNSASSYQYNPDPFNVGNRTIYLGNLHPNTTVEEIANNVRAGGLVESIRYHPDKRVCFITFIDPTIALKFYLNHQVLHQLIIHGYDITVGWAKNHSGALNRDISLAVTAGASRNVYIGIKLNKDENNGLSSTPKDEKIRLPNESVLRSDFSKFGDLEQINFYHNKDCGFLNFINITDAIKLVDSFESRNVPKINKIVGDSGEFYDKYKVFKISFAKDRCGNPPKFSFKKKLGKRKNKKPEDDSVISKLDHNEDGREEVHEEAMNEEAAMVFGIMSTAESIKEISTSNEDKESEETRKKFEQPDITISGEAEKENNKNDEYEKTQANIKDVKREVPDTADEDDEDDEDDDDISIIIGSDETTYSTRDELKKSRNSSDKFYNNKVNTSDTFIPLRKSSRNSSNISLNSHNSNYTKYYNQDSKFPPSPYHHHPQQQQQLYYMQNSQRPMASRMNSFGYGGYYPPPNPNPNQYTYTANPSKNPYSTSGSQVMSQYLAKSQHDNLLYAASILSNDVGMDEDKEYHYKPNSRRNSKK